MAKPEPESLELEFVENDEELARVVPIRTETTLSRYPFHKIAKKTDVRIKQTKRNERGKVVTTWEVRNPPGPLAYKLDTLVINRRIDEMRNRGEIKQLFKLGSLRDICQEMGINPNGKATNAIKEALRQNAFAGITCKLDFKGNDGQEREFEFNTTRYTVIFTGEKLPNEKRADAIYIELHPRFHEMLKHSKTRPLDYEYLRELPPSAQRLYELLSFAMYGTLKHKRPNAQMLYSEFCQSAPLTRYLEWDKVRPQMWKIHNPHIESGYIKSVEFEEVLDVEGNPDWVMRYTPGKKARHEFKEFSSRSIAGQSAARLSVAPKLKALPSGVKQAGKQASEQANLFAGLLALGVGEKKAQELVDKHPDRVQQELEAFPHRKLSGVDNPQGWLIRAIERGDYSQPPKVEAKRQEKAHAKRTEALKGEREQLEREYFKYLGKKLDALPLEHAEAFRMFSQDFESFWSLVCKNLSEDKREMMKIHHFEKFVKDNQGLKVLSFDEWAKKRKAASKKA